MNAFDDIMDNVNDHCKQTEKEDKSASWWATALRWSIPILSAIVTVVIGKANLENTGIWLSLLVTILTTANSIVCHGEVLSTKNTVSEEIIREHDGSLMPVDFTEPLFRNGI
jgi:hypothetical protein